MNQEDVIKVGVLVKKSRNRNISFKTNWQERTITLTKGCLYYSTLEGVVKGSIVLSPLTVVELYHEREPSFKIISGSDELVLCCADEDQRDEWMEQIQAVSDEVNSNLNCDNDSVVDNVLLSNLNISKSASELAAEASARTAKWENSKKKQQLAKERAVDARKKSFVSLQTPQKCEKKLSTESNWQNQRYIWLNADTKEFHWGKSSNDMTKSKCISIVHHVKCVNMCNFSGVSGHCFSIELEAGLPENLFGSLFSSIPTSIDICVENADVCRSFVSFMNEWKGVVTDPYLMFGGAYEGDMKDTDEFKYVTFAEFPKFTKDHKSAMAKHLTNEVFGKLKNVTTASGYTLSNAIMTGVVTPHLGVGATAGDEECWELFKDLYYPIIKEWHGYDAAVQKHPVNLDFTKLKFTEEQKALFNEYVASTRIRAARNISGYCLPPGATSEDRAAVEGVLKQTFAGLTGELAGTYYELGGLTKEQTQFLLEKGFLFQIPSSKNLLTGAGAARSWPENRGIFHNEAQTALCWVNEEDHCRIISMETGGNIRSVFERFCNLSNAVKKSAEANNTKLMWNETLGFMGTCPSNLGTGLRASVMLVIPNFNKLFEGDNEEDKHLLDEVCDAYDLQPRGSAGEHSAAVGGKFDISNKQRLGYSEVELVQKMIDGVTKVIEYEKMLGAGATPGEIRAACKETRK